MTDLFKTLLELPEPVELIRRALIVQEIYDALYGTATITMDFNTHHANRYFWEDGSGQEANIIWRTDGQHDDSILLLGYEHESTFNVFSDEGAFEKQTALRELPPQFAYLGEDPALFWSWEDSKLVYATVTAWWDTASKRWATSEVWLDQAEHSQDDGGLEYCFEVFTVEPNVDAYMKHFSEEGYNDDPDGLRATVTQALAKHPTV